MNKVIYRQGAAANFLYIVYSGEFQILRSQKKRQQKLDTVEVDRSMRNQDEKLANTKSLYQGPFHDKQSSPTKVQGKKFTRMSNGNANQLNKSSPANSLLSTTFPIKIAGKGELLGWEDILEGRRRTSSARCVSMTGTIFKIDAKIFMECIFKDDEMKEQMRKMLIERDYVTIKKIRQFNDLQKTMSENTSQKNLLDLEVQESQNSPGTRLSKVKK